MRGVSIFAMLSAGTFTERRLIHRVVSIWGNLGYVSCFYAPRLDVLVFDFVYFCYRTGCLLRSKQVSRCLVNLRL